MMIDDSDVVYDLRLMDFSKTFPFFPFSLSASNLCITVNSNLFFYALIHMVKSRSLIMLFFASLLMIVMSVYYDFSLYFEPEI